MTLLANFMMGWRLATGVNKAPSTSWPSWFWIVEDKWEPSGILRIGIPSNSFRAIYIEDLEYLNACASNDCAVRCTRTVAQEKAPEHEIWIYWKCALLLLAIYWALPSGSEEPSIYNILRINSRSRGIQSEYSWCTYMSLATFYLVYSSSSRTNGRRVKYNNDLILEIQSIKRYLGSVIASYYW